MGAESTMGVWALGGGGTTIVAFRTGQDLDALLPSLRRFIEAPGSAAE